jgi:hypothetical protein
MAIEVVAFEQPVLTGIVGMFRSPTTQVYWPPFTIWDGSYCLPSEVSALGVYAKAKAALERAVDAQKQ